MLKSYQRCHTNLIFIDIRNILFADTFFLLSLFHVVAAHILSTRFSSNSITELIYTHTQIQEMPIESQYQPMPRNIFGTRQASKYYTSYSQLSLLSFIRWFLSCKYDLDVYVHVSVTPSTISKALLLRYIQCDIV